MIDGAGGDAHCCGNRTVGGRLEPNGCKRAAGFGKQALTRLASVDRTRPTELLAYCQLDHIFRLIGW